MSYQLPVPDTDLEEARAELLHFAAGMGKTGVEPSTATPSERESRPEHQDMDQDANREKRIEMDGERPPAKFAKAEAKGDQRLEEAPQTGKGSQAPTLGAANKSPARELQTAQGSLSSGGDGSQLRKGSRQNPYQQWGSRSWNRQGSNWSKRENDRRRDKGQVLENERLRNLLLAVARLTLRMEDTISIQQLDVEFIIFMQMPAIAEKLYEVGQNWHKKKEAEPSSLDQPMRSVLLFCLLTALLEKVQELEVNGELMQLCKDRGLVVDARSYNGTHRPRSASRRRWRPWSTAFWWSTYARPCSLCASPTCWVASIHFDG